MQSCLRVLIWGAAQLQAIVAVMLIDTPSKEPYGWSLYLSAAAISGLVSLAVLGDWRGKRDTPMATSRVVAVSFGVSVMVSFVVGIVLVVTGH